MTSTIRVDNVAPSAGGTSRSLVRGTAAAWVNFNGTGTIAPRDSENVSSLTDNGTGDYTVNFSNAFGAADYAVSFGGGTAAQNGPNLNVESLVVGSFNGIFRRFSAGSKSSYDYDILTSSIYGDLA